MTRDKAKEVLSIIAAYANGEAVQYFNDGAWRDATLPSFTDGIQYRIKPRPSVRPWSKPEDVPVGAWLADHNEDLCALITAVSSLGVSCIGPGGAIRFYPWARLENSNGEARWTLDRKTFHPCTITED